MMNKAHRVCVYIFDAEDGSKPQERLKSAVREYCKEYDRESRLAVLPVEELMIERTEKGKPYFSNCPQLQFSISHSGAFWACAIAEEQVGMDLQEHSRLKNETIDAASDRFLKMARRFFHEIEAKFVELNTYHNFFTVWTAREAYVKYTGQGIDKYFSEYCVVPKEEEMWSHMSGQTLVAGWKALGQSFWKTEYRENYTLCVCTKTECECRIIFKEKK